MGPHWETFNIRILFCSIWSDRVYRKTQVFPIKMQTETANFRFASWIRNLSALQGIERYPMIVTVNMNLMAPLKSVWRPDMRSRACAHSLLPGARLSAKPTRTKKILSPFSPHYDLRSTPQRIQKKWSSLDEMSSYLLFARGSPPKPAGDVRCLHPTTPDALFSPFTSTRQVTHYDSNEANHVS